MVVTAGVDIGSTYTKVVLLDDFKRIGYGLAPTGASSEGAAQDAFNQALQMAKISKEIRQACAEAQ